MQNHHRAVSFDTLTGNDPNLFCVVEPSITETFLCTSTRLKPLRVNQLSGIGDTSDNHGKGTTH